MPRFYSDDPVRDFDRYDAMMAQQEARLPKCEKCGDVCPESFFEIDGELLCEECMRDRFERSTDDYLSDNY